MFTEPSWVSSYLERAEEFLKNKSVHEALHLLKSGITNNDYSGYTLQLNIVKITGDRDMHSDCILWCQRTLETIFFMLHLIEKPDQKIYLDLIEVYRYLTVSMYYSPIKNTPEGTELVIQACEYLVFNKYNTLHSNRTLSNVLYYIKPLKNLCARVLDAENLITPGFHTTTSSIVARNDSFDILVRTVNYNINPNGSYSISDSSNKIITENYLYRFIIGPDFHVRLLDGRPFTDSQLEAPIYPHRIVGQEDVRLFGDNMFLGVDAQANEKNVICLVWGTYDQTGAITQKVPLRVGPDFKVEKNWLPFNYDDVWYIIYKCEPLIIYRLDEILDYSLGRLENCTPIYQKKICPEENLSTFRGGSPPIKFSLNDNPGWLFIIHQAHYAARRKYVHRFVWLSEDWEELIYSRPFYFRVPDIEYCITLVEILLDTYVITYSVDDHSTEMKVCDRGQILSYFD